MLLGAARLFGRGREASGGALLGLACATKQLAWPFAPFLLLTLAGERLRRAVLAAAGVFLLAVAPVAALDPRAFWGDIVLYNAGLGGDLYPFGGTPGIGLANLVLAFGGVRSLSQPFSFAPALLLLGLPLLFLLARDQWRRRDLGAALASGSAALLFVLYFNRVPHANYLIAPAVLLPLAALLGRLPVDAALAPLLLLALATTAMERGAFALLAHDAGAAALSSDPYDLVFSAVAAGFALAYVAAAVLGGRQRTRGALVLVAALALVAVPALVASRGRVPRAQERALVPEAAAREAWSSSFRQEPPASLQERPADSLLSRAASSALRAAGVGDGRVIAVLALAVALVVAVSFAPGAPAAAWAVLALTPAAALGALFGSDAPLWLAAVSAVLWLAPRRSLAAASGAGALLVLVALLDAALVNADPGPGLGLVNLAAYCGWESAVSLQVGRVLGQLAAVAVAGWTWRRARSLADVLCGVSLGLLLVLSFAPVASPFRLGPPTAFIGLAALVSRITPRPPSA
jgi:hypothetical protein